MLTRDELEDWALGAPPWLVKIITSHIEAWKLLEAMEVEAAGLREALAATLSASGDAGPLEAPALGGAAGRLLSGNLERAAAPDTPLQAQARRALSGQAGRELLETLQALSRARDEALGALVEVRDALGAGALDAAAGSALRARCEAALARASQGGSG